MAKLHHTMFRVLDLERSIRFWNVAFGLRERHRFDFEKFTLVYLADADGGAEIELTLNKGRTEPYGHDDGYGHVAFVVEDLDAEHARFAAEGFGPKDIVDFAPDGERVARFFFVDDPDGYAVEVIQRGGHFVPPGA